VTHRVQEHVHTLLYHVTVEREAVGWFDLARKISVPSAGRLLNSTSWLSDRKSFNLHDKVLVTVSESRWVGLNIVNIILCHDQPTISIYLRMPRLSRNQLTRGQIHVSH